MIRRRGLRKGYFILWLAGGVIMLIFSLKKHWLNLASDAAGTFYPPSFLFFIGMLFILLILIHGKFHPAGLRNGGSVSA